MGTLAVTNSFSAGTTIVAADMNTNFDDIESFVNTTPGVVQIDIVNAKGDIVAATAADAVSRLAVGTDTYVLTADSGEATGLIWAAPTTGDITAVVAGTNIGGGATSGSATVNLSIDAEVACADQVVSRAQMKDYAETVNAIGSKSAAFNIDFEDGNVQTVTISSGTFNIGLTNSLASHSNSVTILGTNLGAGTPSFVAGAHGGGGNAVVWAGGTAPTYTASGTDVLCFTTFDGGTTFYGFAAGLDFS
jgi:hypothetical protein